MASQLIRKIDFQRMLFDAINLNTISNTNRLAIAFNHLPESVVLAGFLGEIFPKNSLHAISVDLKINQQLSKSIAINAQCISKLGIKTNALEIEKQDQTKTKDLIIDECIKQNISILASGETIEDYLTYLLKEIFSQKAGYIRTLDIQSNIGSKGNRIQVLRPFLKFSTYQVLESGKEYRFLELSQDPSIPRNSVRKLIQDSYYTESDRIGDTFLTVPQLLEFGFDMHEHRQQLWKRGNIWRFKWKVSAIFKRDIRCDESLGLYFIKADISNHDQEYHWMSDTEISHTIFTILLAMVNGLDPLEAKFSFEVLESFRSALCGEGNYFRKLPVSQSKGCLNPPRASETGRGIWIFGRRPLTKTEKEELSISVKSNEIVFWDNRFKISVSTDIPNCTFKIRPFTIQDIKAFEENLLQLSLPIDTLYTYKERLNLFNSRTPVLLREVLPCIEMNGKLICIPFLNINTADSVKVDFKYCGYRSVFGKVIGLTREQFRSPDDCDPLDSKT